MKKLTAEKCREQIAECHALKERGYLSISGEYKLQALEHSLKILEQQSKWIKCSEKLPVIDEHSWRTDFPVLVQCEIGVVPAYYGYSWHEGEKHFGFLESLRYGNGEGHSPAELSSKLMANVTHWQFMPLPVESKTDTYRQIENDGWIEWKGGLCPVEGDLWIEIRLRSGLLIGPRQPYCWVWEHGVMSDDIIAYRVIENDGREE